MAKKKQKSTLEGAVMTEQGLSYKGFILDPIVEKCEGCERVVSFPLRSGLTASATSPPMCEPRSPRTAT